ncbi:hypothetical protein VTJ04DRAFT_495 [Mycothermus thermophilus]|uniref:uncharacterized protein n=1 Tax=Humicola insolens TaxID=85995 RepID=UPI003743F895
MPGKGRTRRQSSSTLTAATATDLPTYRPVSVYYLRIHHTHHTHHTIPTCICDKRGDKKKETKNEPDGRTSGVVFAFRAFRHYALHPSV